MTPLPRPRRQRLIGAAALFGSAVALAGCAAAQVPDDGLSHPEHFSWSLLGTTADGKAVRIQANVDHGGCKYPMAVAKRDGDEVWIEALRGAVDCEFETMELVSGGVVTVGLPVKLGAEEVRITGPGYRGVQADPEARFGQPQRYPGVIGLDLPTARAVLRANGIRDIAIVGPNAAGSVVRIQWPAAGDLHWRTRQNVRPDARGRTSPPPLRPATLVVMERGEYRYPWPSRLSCTQAGRLTAYERAAADRSLLPRGC